MDESPFAAPPPDETVQKLKASPGRGSLNSSVYFLVRAEFLTARLW